MDKEINDFLEGLHDPVGSHRRCTFFIGQRGMGKTALLLELAEKAAQNDYVVALVTAYESMGDNVFEPILKPLSDNDIKFLYAMAEDEGESRVSDICTRMKKSNSYVQPYRARLIDAGIIEAPRSGSVTFAVPYMLEYLKKKNRIK